LTNKTCSEFTSSTISAMTMLDQKIGNMIEVGRCIIGGSLKISREAYNDQPLFRRTYVDCCNWMAGAFPVW